MATPKDNPHIAEEWQTYGRHRLQQDGASLNRVSAELALKYSCSPTTVRRHLDPAYAARERLRGRASERRRYARRKREQRYNRNYHRLTRPGSQERLVVATFGERQGATLNVEEIAELIQPLLEGVSFKHSIIEKRFLQPYVQQQRGPPFLARTRDGYKLQESCGNS